MAISLKCGRCGKVYSVAQSQAGRPVQCARCRFIMVIPGGPGLSDFKAQEESDRSVPSTHDWDAAVAREESAVASEVTRIVVRRRQWFGRRKYSATDEAAPASRKWGSSNVVLIAIALLPVLVGAACIYWFVPWHSLFSSRGTSSPTVPPAPIASDHPSDVDGSVTVPQTQPVVSAPPVAPVDEWKQPVPNNLPSWLPVARTELSFGPYLAADGFAIQGPVAGMHLIRPAKGVLAWMGPGGNGMRASLLLTIVPTEDPAQTRRRSSPDELVEVGRLGPDALAATRVHSFGRADGVPFRRVEYDVYDHGRHLKVQITTAPDDNSTADLLVSGATSLRLAQEEDVSLTPPPQPLRLPSEYDPAARAADWSAEPRPETDPLQPTKHGLGYSIRPPTGLRLVGAGVWGGNEGRVPAIDPDAHLPLLEVGQKSQGPDDFSTTRAWADDQWSRFGRETAWGTIDGVLFARIRYADSSAGAAATCTVYATVNNGKIWTLTTATWRSFPMLDIAVRTFKFTKKGS